jgi:hypothetical protein
MYICLSNFKLMKLFSLLLVTLLLSVPLKSNSQVFVNDSASFKAYLDISLFYGWGFGGFETDKHGNSYGALNLSSASFEHFYDTVTVGSYPDVCLYRFDNKGNLTLKKTYGNSIYSTPNNISSITIGENNDIYLTGVSRYEFIPDSVRKGTNLFGSYFIGKVNGEGEFQYGFPVNGKPFIEVKENGNVYFIYTSNNDGYLGYEYISSSLISELIFGELDPEGNLLWYEQSGISMSGLNGMRPIRGIKHKNDHLYFYGEFEGTVSFGANTIELSSDYPVSAEGESEMYLAKLNMSTKTFERVIKTSELVIKAIDLDENENVYVLQHHFNNGNNSSSASFLGTSLPYSQNTSYISKLNSNLDLITLRKINETSTTNYSILAYELKYSNDDIFVLGNIDGNANWNNGNPVNFENDFTLTNPYTIFLAKYSSNLIYKSAAMTPVYEPCKTRFMNVTDNEVFVLASEDAWYNYIAVYKQKTNTISGKVYKDFNMNNNYNIGSDVLVKGSVISVTPSAIKTVINNDGTYLIHLDTGNYQLNLENIAPYYQVQPTNTFFSFTNVGQSTLLDFKLWPIPGANDVKVDFFPESLVIVGEDTRHKIIVTNEGTNTVSGNIKLYPLNYSIPFSSFQFETSPVMIQEGLYYKYPFTNLVPSDTIEIGVNYFIPTDFLAILNETSNTNVEVEIIENDTNISNNYGDFYAPILAGYDPNYKFVNQSKLIDIDSINTFEYFEYTIHFQNEGNYFAKNIYIEDEISSHLDINSLQVIDYSHPVTTSIHNNKIKFSFDSIMLPWKDADELGSQGFVHFKIKKVNNLELGDTINNTAYIYFDYNPAIITNQTQNIICEDAINDIGELNTSNQENNILIYPNPSANDISIIFDKAYNGEISILNTNGQILEKSVLSSSSLTHHLSVKHLNPGIYFLKFDQKNSNILNKKVVIE